MNTQGIINNFAAGSSDIPGLVKFVLIISAYVLPFILIPFMIKSLSGAFGNLAGMVNDKGKGLLDRNSKWRGNKRQQKMGAAKAGNRFEGGKDGGVRRKFSSAAGYGMNIQKAGLRPSLMRAKMAATLGDDHYEHAMEQAEKLPGAKAFFSNDDLMMAGLKGKGSRAMTERELAKKGYQGDALKSGVEQVMNMRAKMGDQGFALAALTKLPATGTAYEQDDIGQWHKDIATYTHGNKSLQGTIVAAGKAGFRASQRYEVSEAGFGDHMNAIRMAEGGMAKEDITDMVIDRAYASGGPAAVVGARNAKSAKMFSRAINTRVKAAKARTAATGDNTAEMRELAAVASIHDQIGQSKRIVGDVLADQVLSAGVNGDGANLLPEIEALRGDEKFRETRKEYGATEAERQEAMRRGLDPSAGLPEFGSIGPRQPGT